MLPVCSYDKQNLEYSGLFILGSLTPKFRSELEHAVGLDASGVEILICIIECKLSLQVSRQRELISKLERRSLVNEPGENIPIFNIKVTDLCEQIEKHGPAPSNLNIIVMYCDLNCSVVIFAQNVNSKYFELQTNPTKHPWHNTI